MGNNQSSFRKATAGRSAPSWNARRRYGRVLLAAAMAAVLGVGGLWLGFIAGDPRHSPVFGLERIANALSFYLLGRPPHVYGLIGEKNGRVVRLAPSETFPVTFRDEFVFREV
ncbi:MAG TPA: hypothetical protein P5255_14980, partial [Phycisphaerae bacterium]|nr:hypothetical protein [Phycisphaerae bacterium]